MSKVPPFNGPSKTGNPSGASRGNNPSWDEDDGGVYTRWPSSPRIPALAAPSPEEVRRAELTRLTKVAVDEAVARIQGKTRNGLRKELLDQRARLLGVRAQVPNEMSAGMQKKAFQAVERNLRDLDLRLDNDIAMAIRKAREELPAADARAMEIGLLASLGVARRRCVQSILASAEGWFSKEIRNKVSLEQLFHHLGFREKR